MLNNWENTNTCVNKRVNVGGRRGSWCHLKINIRGASNSEKSIQLQAFEEDRAFTTQQYYSYRYDC